MESSRQRRGMLNLALILLALVAVALASAFALGAHRWDGETARLRARLTAERIPVRPRAVSFRELEGLPAPVQKYFRAVLTEGQPMIAMVRLRHTGTFNMGEDADQWRPFRSDQQVVTRRPGFDWNGRIAMMPGLPVRVHDAYIAGEGILHASLFGLVSLARLGDSGDMAEGELMRFLAEAAWYPTALLPSQGIRWEPVDDRSARATLTGERRTVTMTFAFDEHGLIETVRAESRGRVVSGRMVPTPWQGRFWNYGERDRMRVPLDGEVGWLLPAGAKPYWRGHTTDIAYEFEP